MKEKILLVGGGGHCKACIDVIEQAGKFQIAGIIDLPEKLHQLVLGYSVIGCDEDLPDLIKSCPNVLVTLGQLKSPVRRMEIFNDLQQTDALFPVIQSPLAYVSPHAQVAGGTIVMHHALINAGARVGRNCIINTKALVEHDAIIEDHCHISTGAVINGGVRVGSGTFFGSNSMSREHIKIGHECVIGGGAECVAKRIRQKPSASLKIGYFGDGPWAHEAFLRIKFDPTFEIGFICARFDNPDKKLEYLALENDIPFYVHPNINSDEFLKKVSASNCDIFVSMSFNQIFKPAIINLPSMKTINCHAGALPFYRGRNILNWALINDEKFFGITAHYMDEGIDTGDIILQRFCEIGDKDDYGTLLKKAHTKCAEVLYDALKILQSYEIEPIKQTSIDPVGFYCGQRKEGDEGIDWNQTTREIFNFIRALCKPGPMARSFVMGKEIKINKSAMVGKASVYRSTNGSVVGIEKNGFLVKTADSFIRIVEWQYDGRIKMGDRLAPLNKSK